MSETPQAEPTHVHDVPGTSCTPVDLDAVESDLRDVELSLTRLADGTYWTDEVTGEPIAEHVLVRNPLARRA